jgi:hypothetical protein
MFLILQTMNSTKSPLSYSVEWYNTILAPGPTYHEAKRHHTNYASEDEVVRFET